jgi:hypothetical protein
MRSAAWRPGARSPRARVLLVVCVPAALALSACEGSSSAQSASTTSTSTSSSESTGAGSGASTSTTTTSAVLPTTMATLAVVVCPTTYAIATTTTTTLPASVSVSVPAAAAANLVVYGDDNGIMMMIGPKGWTCHAAYGADGSGGLLISPVGESVPSDPDSGWHLPASSTAQAIVGYEVGVSPVQAAGLACPLFSAAAALYKQTFGHACTPRPTAESAVATGPTGAGVAFEDPAGVAGDGRPSGGTNPANGVLLYLPSWPGRAAAYLATCTLPAAQHDVCTAVLNDFTGLYG